MSLLYNFFKQFKGGPKRYLMTGCTQVETINAIEAAIDTLERIHSGKLVSQHNFDKLLSVCAFYWVSDLCGLNSRLDHIRESSFTSQPNTCKWKPRPDSGPLERLHKVEAARIKPKLYLVNTVYYALQQGVVISIQILLDVIDVSNTIGVHNIGYLSSYVSNLNPVDLH